MEITQRKESLTRSLYVETGLLKKKFHNVIKSTYIVINNRTQYNRYVKKINWIITRVVDVTAIAIRLLCH